MIRARITASSPKIGRKATQLSNINNHKCIISPIGTKAPYRQIIQCVTSTEANRKSHKTHTIDNGGRQQHRNPPSSHHGRVRERAYHPSPHHHRNHSTTPPPSPASPPHTTTRTVPEAPNPASNYEDDVATPIRRHHTLQRPLVVRTATAFLSSPRLARWRDTSYLRRTVGEQTVCDIEIGGSFDRIGDEDDTSVTSSSIQFGDYISYLDMAIDACNDDNNGDGTPLEPSDVVYLAQNEIFDGLKGDFTPPKFCTDGSVGRGDLYATKIWIGPAGTVSSLHYDPLDNVLLQIVGQKVVTLYPPVGRQSVGKSRFKGDDNDDDYGDHEESLPLSPSSLSHGGDDYYYAGKGPSRQINVSAVDIERPDLEKFPNFRSAVPLGLKVTLWEGDMLFIPKRWWHHVRGDSAWSLSLNCWWN